MKGSIIRRGKKSWRIIFDVGRDPVTGKRLRHYHTVRGTRQEAEQKRADLLSARGKGDYVAPSKVTVGEWVRARIAHWETVGGDQGPISPKTRERYDQLTDAQIVPRLGSVQLQKLTPADIEKWHAQLLTSGRKDGGGGVSARTIGHAHRVLGHALKDALLHALVSRNVASLKSAPSIDGRADDGDGDDDAGDGGEMKILGPDEQKAVLDGLRGKPLYPLVVLALYTGLRRGELAALKWRAIDLDAKTLAVRLSLEQTKARGLRFKVPKTKKGRRTVSLPAIVVDTLRDLRQEQIAQRLAIEKGIIADGGVVAFPAKLPDDALVFPNSDDGGPQSPNAISKAWALAADGFAVGDVTLHGLRHTHASQLIDRDVDIVTISRRLGHASPAITLKVYAHLFRKDDSKAADAIDAALAGLGQA